MAITYDAGNNIITVTGYTEGAPCNFTNIYNADKAGTLSLHARTGITGVDADPVATDRAERPADYVVLGGASNDLYITVANWNGTTATIQITGTDRDGAAQTEDIVITADGDYYTTKWFKTITQTQVTAFTGTSFDYDLTQGQWGVVTMQCDNQFCFTAALRIGDGSTTTWFADEAKQVLFNTTPIATSVESTDYKWVILQKANSNVRFGRIEDAAKKTTSSGCQLIFNCSAHCAIGSCLINPPATAKAEIYSTTMISITGYVVFIWGYDSAKMWNSLLTYDINPAHWTDADINLTVIQEGMYGALEVFGTVENTTITGSEKALTAGSDMTKVLVNKNGIFYDNTYLIHMGIPAYDVYFVNTTTDGWTINWVGATKLMYRKYEIDLKVIDKDGNGIDGATVKIWDKDNNLVVDTTTTGGVIATQTISRGYYNQTNGDTLQEYSPHLIKIEKAGYTPYEADFTLEEKTDWTIALQGVLKRNPAMTGGMV